MSEIEKQWYVVRAIGGKEAKVKELPANQQMEIRRTLEAKFAASAGKNAQKAAAKQLPAADKKGGAQPKQKAKQSRSGSDYLGQKK